MRNIGHPSYDSVLHVDQNHVECRRFHDTIRPVDGARNQRIRRRQASNVPDESSREHKVRRQCRDGHQTDGPPLHPVPARRLRKGPAALCVGGLSRQAPAPGQRARASPTIPSTGAHGSASVSWRASRRFTHRLATRPSHRARRLVCRWPHLQVAPDSPSRSSDMPTRPTTPKTKDSGATPFISGRSNPNPSESSLVPAPRSTTIERPGTTPYHEKPRRYHCHSPLPSAGRSRTRAAPNDGAVREPRYGRRGPLAGAAAPAGAPRRSIGAPGRPSWPGRASDGREP